MLMKPLRRFHVEAARPHHHGLATEAQHGAVDQSGREQLAGAVCAGLKRVFDLAMRERADIARDKTIAEIAVRLQQIGRASRDRRMARQVDCIGNDGRRRVGLRCGPRQHGHAVGDAEREAAAMAAAGGDAARGIIGLDDHGPHHAEAIRPVHQADGELLAATEMQRDVAAIVDIGAIERRLIQHRTEDFLGHCARHRRHRRDEAVGREWRDGRMHAARDDAFQHTACRHGRLAQFDQFRTEFVEQAGEAPRRGIIGRANFRRSSLRAHDQVDRTVLQMQPPAIGKQRDLRSPRHARRPGSNIKGRISALSRSEASGRT